SALRTVDLPHIVEAFEAALERDGNSDLAAFLPAEGHPLYLSILSELIRVDLEKRWKNQAPHRLADYGARFPAILHNASILESIAFEEYRQRRWHGEKATPEEYRQQFQVDPEAWPSIASATEGPKDFAGPPSTKRV